MTTSLRCTNALVTLVGLFLTLCLTVPSAAVARDWFVRAGADAGDGSRATPFNDPWRAFERCEAGDQIHVATGTYFGRFGNGTWEILFDRVQMLGGYDAQFSVRNPWQNPTQLGWDSMSKNWPKAERLTSHGKDVVVDGIVIDMQDQNFYIDAERSGRTERPGQTAMLFTEKATVRNCIILNPGLHAIDTAAGSTIENNVVINPIMWGIVIAGAGREPATIRNNTVVFAWDTQNAGGGGYGGAAVALRGPAVVANNILAHGDNTGIYSVTDPSRVSISGNLFWKNRFSNITAELGAQRAVVGDTELEMLEEVGLAQHAGNTVSDPGLAFDPAWLQRTTKREEQPAAPKPAGPPPSAWEAPKKLEVTKGVAPAMTLAMATQLLKPRSADNEPGARIIDLPVPVFAAQAVAAAKTHDQTRLTDWSRTPRLKAGKSISMVVAVGGVANINTMPVAYPKDAIAGVFLYDPDGNGEHVTGFYRKGSTADKVASDATGYYQGRGKPERLHVVRGIAYEVAGLPKGALFIETIERWEPAAAGALSRAKGRDWFVLAGATGGDGSREKPFRDPFQALERCEAGDTIHVAGGDYVGKLKAGHWSIGMSQITLLGGYDPTFTTRAPWQNPTRLFCPPDFKGPRGGYTLEGSNDHTGAVIDGFVFDKRGNNIYLEDGEIDMKHSDKTEHLWLSRPGCVVRNCLFLNGAFGAVRAANGQTFENNVFVNHITLTVSVESGHTTAPFVFRDNTVLFSWTRSYGYGLGANGNLLRLGGRVHAEIENNIFAYADNDAIRLETDPRDVTLRGNVFAHNLWSHLQQMAGWHSFDDQTFAQLADLGFRAYAGNHVAEAELAIDPTWLSQHQASRGPEKFTKKEPTPAAIAAASAVNPFDTPPSGSASAATSSGNPFESASASASVPAAATAPVAANPFDESPPAKTAGASPQPFAPAYDLPAAVKLFAPGTGAGARATPLTVAFTGVTRVVETHAYVTRNWDVAKTADTWGQLSGQRVALQVGIQRTDNQFFLPAIKADDYLCVLVTGPEGVDSGLPLRCYVKKGTQAQRVIDDAKDFQGGKPIELYIIKGIAMERRQLIVEAIEKAR